MAVFRREGDFVRFSQSGRKLAFPDEASDDMFYEWLDQRIDTIDTDVPGSSIIERLEERTLPRRNSGVYYDTAGLDLLQRDVVLRTTSNPKTHAYCACKFGEDAAGVRRDHRYVFSGDEKSAIQRDPYGAEAVSVVRSLLSRRDVDQPGLVLAEEVGVDPLSLRPTLSLVQLRRTFYVLLDGRDALRCSLDRADIRLLVDDVQAGHTEARFSEVELPIFPRISDAILQDGRTWQLIDFLASSLAERFGCTEVLDSKYRRAMKLLGFNPAAPNITPTR